MLSNMAPSTEQQLRQEIWNDPTNRQLLSVYADWLDAAGDGPRAEFMHLSLLAKRTPAQNKRLIALRNKHRGAWLGGARPFIYTWEEDEESAMQPGGACALVLLVPWTRSP